MNTLCLDDKMGQNVGLSVEIVMKCYKCFEVIILSFVVLCLVAIILMLFLVFKYLLLLYFHA